MEKGHKPLVAIVDDDEIARERFADYMFTEGYEPIVFNHKISSIKNLLSEADLKGIEYGIFDHRLTEGHYANFLGAEGVSIFNEHLKASILVTGYEKDDSETTIRPYRRKIPILLHMSEVSSNALNLGLQKVYKEILEKQLPPERQPCRSILTITNIFPKSSITIIKVIVSQWDSRGEIGFPLNMLPFQLREHAKIGNHLIADVNVDALKAEDIYFENFSLPNKDALNRI